MLLSYAVGYALSTDFPGSNMKDLFRYADKNMYVDKNRAKMKKQLTSGELGVGCYNL